MPDLEDYSSDDNYSDDDCLYDCNCARPKVYQTHYDEDKTETVTVSEVEVASITVQNVESSIVPIPQAGASIISTAEPDPINVDFSSVDLIHFGTFETSSISSGEGELEFFSSSLGGRAMLLLGGAVAESGTSTAHVSSSGCPTLGTFSPPQLQLLPTVKPTLCFDTDYCTQKGIFDSETYQSILFSSKPQPKDEWQSFMAKQVRSKDIQNSSDYIHDWETPEEVIVWGLASIGGDIVI